MSIKKQLVVVLGTLSAIPILLLAPGFGDSMINRTGIIMGIIPLAIFLSYAATCEPSQAGTFFAGVAIIILGVASYVLLDSYGHVAIAQTTAQDVSFWSHGKDTWLLFFPFLCLGLGINLTSTYITHSPENGPR